MFEPYFASGRAIYLTDGVIEVVVEEFSDNETAELVCKLLNGCYAGAYQDGQNTSLREKHRELIDKVTSLSFKNLRLEAELKKYKS